MTGDERNVRLVAWQRADVNAGHSLARRQRLAGGWRFDATEVVVGPEVTLSCSLHVVVDSQWRTREVDVSSVSWDGTRALSLRVDTEQRWWRDGVHLPELDGCLDVDVAATPLTNTFPIRRLAALKPGASSTTPIAWVDVPALGVSRVDQTYLRLESQRWQYSDDRHGAFVLTVDEDGLVVDYEGFAHRIRG